MSMTFYCYRPDATRAAGSYGPLDEMSDHFHFGAERRLDPTPEQEREAGWFHGPNVSNSNAGMILRALGYDGTEAASGAVTFKAAELLGRVTLAAAVPPIADDGMPTTVSRGRGATMVNCGVRPGYFSDRYADIAAVCEQALAWGVDVVLA